MTDKPDEDDEKCWYAGSAHDVASGSHPGMWGYQPFGGDLRDQFACHALAVLVPHVKTQFVTYAQIADVAYGIADAMLVARMKVES